MFHMSYIVINTDSPVRYTEIMQHMTVLTGILGVCVQDMSVAIPNFKNYYEIDNIDSLLIISYNFILITFA